MPLGSSIRWGKEVNRGVDFSHFLRSPSFPSERKKNAYDHHIIPKNGLGCLRGWLLSLLLRLSMDSSFRPAFPLVPIREFGAAKQTILFQSLRKSGFSGRLWLSDPKQHRWCFHLYMGRLIYASGGVHPVRCWRRNLALSIPTIAKDGRRLREDITQNLGGVYRISGEYQLLSYWLQQKDVTREQVVAMLRGILTEIFFDLNQAWEVTYEVQEDESSLSPLVLLDVEPVIVQAWKQWQAWRSLNLGDRNPNHALTTSDPDLLQVRTSPETWKSLQLLLTGDSLRDLSVRLGRDVVDLLRSLLPYLRLGLLSLTEVRDLASPFGTEIPNLDPLQQVLPWIACVDADIFRLENLSQQAGSLGYSVLQIEEPFKAVATLLARRPDLILIAWDLPGMSGIELCRQLRQLNYFRQVPILLMIPANIGLEKMRAKLSGATDFLEMPFSSEHFTEMISRYVPTQS